MTTFFCKPWTNPGQGHERMGRGTKVKPQATLSFTPGRPPVLDPSPAKPQASNTSSWPGQMWSHLANMFNSPPPVYWVNQQMVRECPPPTMPQQYSVMQCPVVDPGGRLWHPAPPGGLQQQQMMEPLQMLEAYSVFPSNKMQVPMYPSSCAPIKIPVKASTKPLNPNAQEWVPREYRNTPSAMPTTPGSGCVGEKVSPHYLKHIPLIPNCGCQDFCEITEKEVEEVRMNGSSSPSGTDGIRQCQAPAPQWPLVTKCDQVEEVTSNLTEESECKSKSHTCLDSTFAGERKVESQVQSRQSQSPLCTWENSASPTAMPEENKSESERELCAISSFPEMKKSANLGQASESQGENSASPTPLCLNSETSERPNLQSSSPGSSGKCTRPDQDQPSPASPVNRLAPELTKTKGQSSALLNQSNSSLASPTQTTNNASEDHRLSPECLHSSPVSQGKGVSPDHKCPSVENSARTDLQVSQSPQYLESATESSASLSYAGVVGRTSPSPPQPVESPEQQKYKGIEQPLPKIFKQDTTPPREARVPRVQGERQALDLFRRPSKTQKTRSRKFLQELKESSLNGGGGLWCGSPPSSTSDLSQSTDDLAEPSSSLCAVPPLPKSPLHCVPPMATSSSQAIPIPTLPPGLEESPGSRTRSSSESSAASLDIEFVEQDVVDRASAERAAPIKGRGCQGPKNGFLACILGSGDSDSDSEDESDLDWDEVCEDDTTLGLDDSWETFGFGLVVVECKMAPLQCQQTHCQAEAPKVEEPCSDSFLKDVNKRWKEEVGKDVRGKSAVQVTFGGEKVHRMVVWSHAYREARRGPWEQQARDRARFAQRVDTLEPMLSQVLDPGHRRAVYRRLYAPPPPRCFI